ncbi:hypothetical protein BAE44_0003029 [Dichanthelium oligosanthes]|uniref:NRR repressor homolog 1 n=1 Tax=Dichanthelium oligosanthes TaxID=888268 RepID=A0A1E5WEY5_9POAL|nr:hypothetical protein BAE44_0003029 [Dichanthelium oligosanthes]
MEGGKKRARRGVEKAAVRPVPPAGCGDADAAPSPARKVPLPDAAALPPPADDEPVAAAEESGAGASRVEEVDDDDDEQVERFYALLANIRALRGLPPYVASAGASCGGGDAGDTATRKRTRHAEPPWRPAFRMEDFEEPAAPAPPSSVRQQTRTRAADDDDDHDGESASGARPAVLVAPSSSLPHAAVRFDNGCNKA